MKAKLQKLAANKDRQDSLQFQLNKDQVEELMELRRYDNVFVEYESDQSTMLIGATEEDHDMDQVGAERIDEMKDEAAGVIFPKLRFQSTNTSMSVCVLEDGWIVTITISFEDPKVLDHVISHKLRDKMVTLKFTEGSNPFVNK